MPPVSFYWPMTLEVNAGGIAVEIEFCCQCQVVPGEVQTQY